MADPPHPVPPELVLRALTRLMRPLVRLLIRSGVTFPTLADVLRGLYVDVARNDLLTDARARTDSRVSLMTGVHRKELRRQRAPEPDSTPAPVTVGSQVAARWLGLPQWVDGQGAPLALPRTAPPGQPSFEALVASVTRDVRARAVLDAWLDQGLVTVTGDGTLHLQMEAFLPQPGSEQQMFYFGRNLHDHMAAAVANIVQAPSPQAPFLDRCVHYDGLSEPAAAELQRLAREAAQRMLLDVNRQALALAESDDKAALPGPRRRVNLGAYLYDEAEPEG